MMATTLASTLLSSHPFIRTGGGGGGQNSNSSSGSSSVSMDSNDEFGGVGGGGADLDMDNQSCCSDDTVLSVGNEQPSPQQTTSAPKTTTTEDNDLSFKNIESHLNAISKITNSTLDPHHAQLHHHHHHGLGGGGSIKSDPSSPSSTIGESSFIHFTLNNNREKSPLTSSAPVSPASQRSSFSPASPQSPPPTSDKHFYFRPGGTTHKGDNNVDATNGGALKFSIDNILKADFGRRITDPINIRKSKPHKKVLVSSEGRHSAGSGGGCSLDLDGHPPAPVDLSKSDADKSPAQPQGASTASATGSGSSGSSSGGGGKDAPMLWPAWVYCTRYSDRPSSGPRTRKMKKPSTPSGAGKVPSGSAAAAASAEEKRPRTAFSGAQLARLKHEFAENRYLTERRRQQLSAELGLNEAQIKIWFQNKRAKIKKASGQKNPLALQLMAQGLYNHSTIPLTKEEEELQEMHNKGAQSS